MLILTFTGEAMDKVRSFDEQADFQYLDGIRHKDHAAFTALYRKYFQGLVLASDKYIKEIGVAKEIVQDVFLKMWEHCVDLDHVVSLKAYLYRTVINASLNHLKREKSIVLHHLKIADEISNDSLDELQAEQELKILIFKEIENLPAQCKRVFKMSRFEGLKYREIAVLLELSEKTVENHMVRALKTLRERLYEKDTRDDSYKLKILTFLYASSSGLLGLNHFIQNN